MTQNHVLWSKATRMLSDSTMFDRERERVLAQYPLLNSRGLGFVERKKYLDSGPENSRRSSTIERIPNDLELSRRELQAGGSCENGIRNTLEYIVEGHVSVSYRLRGCAWARRFNGPAPSRQSSIRLADRVESYHLDRNRKRRAAGDLAQKDPRTSNGAFICAALMLGLQIWQYQNSIHPDLRLGEPWAVAGLQPEDFGDLQDIQMAKFWRWVAQHEITNEELERFVDRTVELLYEGASLDSLTTSVHEEGTGRYETYESLVREYELETGIEILNRSENRTRFGFMAGEIDIPEDFDTMGREEIEELFGLSR